MFYLGTERKDWIQIDQCTVSSLLGAQIFFDQYGNFSWHLNGLRFKNLILFFKTNTLKTYIPESDIVFVTKTLKPRFLSLDKELLDGIKFITSASYKKLNTLSRFIKKTELSSLEDDQLASLFLDYYQVIVNEIFLVNFKPLELAATEALKDLVLARSEDQTQGLRDIALLSTMDKPSASSKEESDLCQIANMTLEPAKIRRAIMRTKNAPRLLERNYPDLFELLDEHYGKYKYLIGGFSELGWEMDDFIRRYTDLLELGSDWTTERISFLSSHTRSIGSKKRKALSRLKDNGQIRKISKIISDLAQLDESNRQAYGQALEIRQMINEEIFERLTIDKQDLNYYTLDEMLTLINDREPIDAKEIIRRSRGVVFNSGVFLYSGADAARFLDKHIPVLPRRHILTGRCAHPGLYEGSVKIVNHLDAAKQVEIGDVVVTNSSGTEFLEAIRKAGAVIVESGGMLSPVAQMCRETNTPCLLEVQSAMLSLKNDDMVIMDAEGQNVCFAEPSEEDHSGVDICSIKIFEYHEDEPSVVRLDEVQPDQAHIFGNKAAHLGLLLREGFQIPPGFAIGRAAMYQYLSRKGCEISDGLYDPETVTRARKALIEENSTEFMQSLPLDATVIFDEEGCAVRASWLPGEIVSTPGSKAPVASTLAIRTLEGLWKAIRKCWLAFLEQPLAVQGDSEESMAMGGGVVIQQFKPGDRSGVIRSIDLEHTGSNVITLEACLGAGHSLYTGRSRPDRYRISRKTERIINRIIPLKTRFEMVQPKTGKLILIPVPEDIVEAEVLTRQQIKILVHAALKTEKIMDQGVALEWTIKGGEIFILSVKFLKKQ